MPCVWSNLIEELVKICLEEYHLSNYTYVLHTYLINLCFIDHKKKKKNIYIYIYIIKFSTKILQIDNLSLFSIPIWAIIFIFQIYLYTFSHTFSFTLISKNYKKTYKNLISNYSTKHPKYHNSKITKK